MGFLEVPLYKSSLLFFNFTEKNKKDISIRDYVCEWHEKIHLIRKSGKLNAALVTKKLLNYERLIDFLIHQAGYCIYKIKITVFAH